jgi:3-oxoacyl-[acyl-carrier protein] reductase
MSLSGKVALVTGGGTGVGRATALLLAEEGAEVAINYSRSEKEAGETAKAVEALGRKAITIRASVADDVAVRAMVARTVDELCGLDILVNNAGITRWIDFKDLEALTDERWNELLDVNLKGTFYCSRAAVPAMLARGGGSIVNISTTSGITGAGSSMAYCASKAGVISLTKSFARTFAPEIRVNCVSPGVTRTRWHDGRDTIQRIEPTLPMKRVVEPEDIAQAVLFFVAGDNVVTGQNLVIDGGLLI